MSRLVPDISFFGVIEGGVGVDCLFLVFYVGRPGTGLEGGWVFLVGGCGLWDGIVGKGV